MLQPPLLPIILLKSIELKLGSCGSKCALATLLLPFLLLAVLQMFSTLSWISDRLRLFLRLPVGVLGCLQRCIDFRGGLLLHSRQDMAVKVQCGANLAVPQALACHLDMRSRSQHVGTVGVP
jgi:hypothetical protein